MYLMIDQDDDTGEVIVVRQDFQELFRMDMTEACQILLIEHQRKAAAQLKENDAIVIAVKALLVARKNIDAIKLASRMLGLSLVNAKLFVDGIRDAMRDAERDKINQK